MGNLNDKKLYGTATVGSKGQVVIPSDAREELNIKPGDKLYVISSMHGAGIVLLKEEKLSEMIDQLSAHVDVFRNLKENHKKK